MNNAIRALFKALEPKPVRTISVDHLERLSEEARQAVLISVTLWLDKYLYKFESRGLDISESIDMAIRLTIAERISRTHKLTLGESLGVMGVGIRDLEEFQSYQDATHNEFIRGYMQLPVRWTHD